MNRKTLFGRFASSLMAAKPAVRPEYTNVRLEALEDRKMLSATYVNDTWTFNGGDAILDEGDQVKSTAPDGALVFGTYGTDAFGIVDGQSLAQFATIYSAIQQTSSGGTLTLLPGTYKESDIVIDRGMTFQGTKDVNGNNLSLIVPEVASADSATDFGAGTHSAIIIYAPSVVIKDVAINGSGNAAIGGGNYDFHHGITTLYTSQDGTQNGPSYASLHNGPLAPIIFGAAGSGEYDGSPTNTPPNQTFRLNQSEPSIGIDHVNVSNVYWHGVTISPLFNRNFDSGQNEDDNLQIANSTITNVGTPGNQDANRIGVLLTNLNDELDSQGNVNHTTVTNAGVGIKTMPYGDNQGGSYDSNNNASNKSYIRFVTVIDPVVNGIEVIDGSRGDAYGWTVNFTGANNATGISLNRSRSAMIGATVTNAKIGIHVQNSPLPIAGGDDDRYPLIAWESKITGNGTAGSVGILVDSKVGDPLASNFLVGSDLTITGWETGVKVEQTTPVGTGLKNTIVFAGGRIFGNTSDVVIGQNSVGGGRIQNAAPIAGPVAQTKLSITGNGTWDERLANDPRDPYYLISPGSPDAGRIAAPPNAEQSYTGNVSFNSSSTYSTLLTGETATAPLFDFNSNVDYPFGSVPDNPVNGIVDAPYGALFGWYGNVTQNDGTLTVGGTATNGFQYEFLFGSDNIDLGNGTYKLVGHDISAATYLNVKIMATAYNQSTEVQFGLLDTRGNVNTYTIDLTQVPVGTYTTVQIPILSPSVDLTGPDSRLDLTNIAGWLFGGDQGVANGLHNVPLGIKVDDISTSSLANSKLNVTGTVNLGGATLNVTLPAGYTPTADQTFTIVDNDSNDAVTGTFAGISNGATATINGQKYQVNYNVGSNSNDVVLTYKGVIPPPSLTFQGAASVSESVGNYLVTVNLSAASASTVNVNWATANGTATAGSDYTGASGTLTFAPGQTAQVLTIAIIDDATPESNETFTINLTSPTNATIGQATFTGTINDNDTPSGSTVAARNIFYNQSKYDSNSALINAAQDALAIATDKTAYIPGSGTSVYNNVSDYSRGINGIMVDLSAGGNHAAITASDFTFKVGNNNTPGSWVAAGAPSAVSVIPNGGGAGIDRVEIIWGANAPKNQWLEVQVKANANTGLATPDVHFWGNKVADSNAGNTTTFATNAADSLQVFLNLGPKPITDARDYNRDGNVNANDSLQVFLNLGSIIKLNVSGAGPFAPEAAPAVAGDDSSAVTSALAAAASPTGLPKVPGWIASRLSSIDLNSGPIAALFTQLAEANTPRSNTVLAKVHQITDALDLDDSLLESLIEGRA